MASASWLTPAVADRPHNQDCNAVGRGSRAQIAGWHSLEVDEAAGRCGRWRTIERSGQSRDSIGGEVHCRNPSGWRMRVCYCTLHSKRRTQLRRGPLGDGLRAASSLQRHTRDSGRWRCSIDVDRWVSAGRLP
ncbi:hypothetical protein MRB53_038953 [Persea americana]|nr:hypothetical protein MRB53_038953 [Persea americana]